MSVSTVSRTLGLISGYLVFNPITRKDDIMETSLGIMDLFCFELRQPTGKPIRHTTTGDFHLRATDLLRRHGVKIKARTEGTECWIVPELRYQDALIGLSHIVKAQNEEFKKLSDMEFRKELNITTGSAQMIDWDDAMYHLKDCTLTYTVSPVTKSVTKNTSDFVKELTDAIFMHLIEMQAHTAPVMISEEFFWGFVDAVSRLFQLFEDLNPDMKSVVTMLTNIRYKAKSGPLTNYSRNVFNLFRNRELLLAFAKRCSTPEGLAKVEYHLENHPISVPYCSGMTMYPKTLTIGNARVIKPAPAPEKVDSGPKTTIVKTQPALNVTVQIGDPSTDKASPFDNGDFDVFAKGVFDTTYNFPFLEKSKNKEHFVTVCKSFGFDPFSATDFARVTDMSKCNASLILASLLKSGHVRVHKTSPMGKRMTWKLNWSTKIMSLDHMSTQVVEHQAEIVQ